MIFKQNFDFSLEADINLFYVKFITSYFQSYALKLVTLMFYFYAGLVRTIFKTLFVQKVL